MFNDRPLTPADYVSVPVGPPSAADEPDLIEENGWLMGQSGDRRVTNDEREALYWAMVGHRRFKDTGSVRRCQKLDAGYLPYRVWHDTCAVYFVVRFKNGKVEDTYLPSGWVDEERNLAFFEGRMNWWWFLGDQVLQIGEYHVSDPIRVTMVKEAQDATNP